MATFVYQAISEEGRRHRGTLTADSPRNARDQLRARGLTVHDLRVTGARQPARWLGRAASVSSVSRFLVDLQVMLGVGTPLVTAIDVLLPDYSGLRDVLLDVRERVCGGSSLAAAMQPVPGCFDPLACSMDAAGEQGGKIEEALQRLNDYREPSG